MRAAYSVSLDGDDLILVTDLCQGKSVTNDAESVIADLAKTYDLTAHRVIYRDTLGVWDGMQVKDGKFVGFVPINARDQIDAIYRARNRPTWP